MDAEMASIMCNQAKVHRIKHACVLVCVCVLDRGVHMSVCE